MHARSGRSRWVAVAAAVVGALALARCADVSRGIGATCIRNEDCLSNVCAGGMCVAAPTVFDAAPAPAASDASSDAVAEAAHDAEAPPADTGTPHLDAHHEDAPLDGPLDGHAGHDAEADSEASDSGSHIDSAMHDARSDTAAQKDAGLHDAGHDSPPG